MYRPQCNALQDIIINSIVIYVQFMKITNATAILSFCLHNIDSMQA